MVKMGKRCVRCGEIKDKSEFYRKSSEPDGLGVYCKDCKREYMVEWRKNHKKNIKKHMRKWRQHVTITTGGRVIKGKKRKRPIDGKCEVSGKECDKEGKPLAYHHWDDENMLKGVWVCARCHALIEGGSTIEDLERRIMELEKNKENLRKWYVLKRRVDEENG